MITTEELYRQLHGIKRLDLDHIITDLQCEYDYHPKTIKKRVDDLPHLVIDLGSHKLRESN